MIEFERHETLKQVKIEDKSVETISQKEDNMPVMFVLPQRVQTPYRWEKLRVDEEEEDEKKAPILNPPIPVKKMRYEEYARKELPKYQVEDVYDSGFQQCEVVPPLSIESALNDEDHARIQLVSKLIGAGKLKDSNDIQKKYVSMLISSKVSIDKDQVA